MKSDMSFSIIKGARGLDVKQDTEPVSSMCLSSTSFILDTYMQMYKDNIGYLGMHVRSIRLHYPFHGK